MACGLSPQSAPYLVLATTTSVGNSGLLDVLVPAWQQESGVEVRPLLVGSGRALRMLFELGEADVAISHAPEAEARMMARHPTAWRYRKIMYNDFVLVGPRGDPAAVRAASTLDDALRRLAASTTQFISRADQSGTHEREESLWRMISARPEPQMLISSGAGMAVTLRQASDREAYTLTDRATFEQLKERVQLEIVYQGDARLLNTYAVVGTRLGPRSVDAIAFMNWLARGGGREIIEDYRIRGRAIRPFTVWPADGGHEPHSLPASSPGPEPGAERPTSIHRARTRAAGIAARAAGARRKRFRSGTGRVSGEHRQSPLEVVTMTRRTLRRLTAADERLELAVALLAGILVQGHRTSGAQAPRSAGRGALTPRARCRARR